VDSQEPKSTDLIQPSTQYQI